MPVVAAREAQADGGPWVSAFLIWALIPVLVGLHHDLMPPKPSLPEAPPPGTITWGLRDRH